MKPIIKWVGGKTQIIDELYKYFPKKINNYYEPFIGGGSVFLKLLEKLENKEIELSGEIYLSDLNKKLINLYNTIKNNKNEFIKKLKELKKNYVNAPIVIHEKRTKFLVLSEEEQISDEKKKSKSIKYYIKKNDKIEDIIKQGKRVVYYYYRDLFNKTDNDILSASLFIFLNKTCWRGVYRIGPNGFNVPYGNNKNVGIFEEEHINKLSNLFNKYKIIFQCKSFENVDMTKLNGKDFFYFDPPYYPLDKKSFVAYQKEGFGIKCNESLLNLCNNLNKNNIHFVLSNSNTEYINKNYNEFTITKINCKRAINSKKPGSKVLEVIIYN
jgi:DNA adenine methylase